MPFKKHRVELAYLPGHVEVTAEEIADCLDLDETSDEAIKRAIREYIGETVSDQPWPQYTLRGHDQLTTDVIALAAKRRAEMGEE